MITRVRGQRACALGFLAGEGLAVLGRKREGRECYGWSRVRGRGGGGLGPNQKENEREGKRKKMRGGSVPSHVSHQGTMRERERER